jgi:hypothetical protein
MKCLRSLEHWDRGLESHLSHGCLFAFILFLCQVAALRWADPPSKGSYQLSKIKKLKWNERYMDALCSKWEQQKWKKKTTNYRPSQRQRGLILVVSSTARKLGTCFESPRDMTVYLRSSRVCGVMWRNHLPSKETYKRCVYIGILNPEKVGTWTAMICRATKED